MVTKYAQESNMIICFLKPPADWSPYKTDVEIKSISPLKWGMPSNDGVLLFTIDD
jgi:hypothetical protein